MKKRIFALALAFAMVFSLAACGSSDSGSGDSGESSDGAYVYWLNMKPEADEALQQLAAAYTEETGIPCKVVRCQAGINVISETKIRFTQLIPKIYSYYYKVFIMAERYFQGNHYLSI